MKNKQLVGLILPLIVIVGAGIITRQIRATPGPAQQDQTLAENMKQDDIPDRIFYGETFSLLSRLKNVGDYQAQAHLTDEEATFLG